MTTTYYKCIDCWNEESITKTDLMEYCHEERKVVNLGPLNFDICPFCEEPVCSKCQDTGTHQC